jgi:hypothetical protein
LFNPGERYPNGINLYQRAEKIETSENICSISGHGLPGIALEKNGASMNGQVLYNKYVKNHPKCRKAKIFLLLICDAGFTTQTGTLAQSFADAAGEGTVVGGPNTWIWYQVDGGFTIYKPKNFRAKIGNREKDLNQPGKMLEFCSGGCK